MFLPPGPRIPVLRENLGLLEPALSVALKSDRRSQPRESPQLIFDGLEHGFVIKDLECRPV